MLVIDDTVFAGKATVVKSVLKLFCTSAKSVKTGRDAKIFQSSLVSNVVNCIQSHVKMLI